MMVPVLEAALFFLAFFMVWYELSVTLIRFTAIDGILDDLLKFAYLAGIVTMALQLSSDDLLNKNIGGFMTGMIICLLCCTLLHIIYYFNIEHCQLYAQRRIVLYCSCICVLLFVSILGVLKLSLFTVFAVSVLILWISSNSFRVILTPNDEMLELPEEVFEHIVERWGVFVMIATGESILAMVATTNDIHEDMSYQHYIAILCAFGITYLVSHYYLESSKINSMHFHALMYPGSPGSVMWTLLHGVLAYLLMLVGAGWKLILHSLTLEVCWEDAERFGGIECTCNTKAYYGDADYCNPLDEAVMKFPCENYDKCYGAVGGSKRCDDEAVCCKNYYVNGECKDYDGSGWIEFSVLLGSSLCLSLIAMYLLRTSHPKFIFSWKSIVCRFPIILVLPIGAYWTSQLELQSFYYSVWCLIVMTISYFVDHLFIDIYQTDINPDLRKFYQPQITPEMREKILHEHLMEAKRKSLEFGRSHSLSRSREHSKSHGHGGHH